MCGIAGILGSAPEDTLRRMTQSLYHRGPDEGAIWLSPSGAAGFGHRRLRILDLTPAARQPMTAAGGRYAMTFNGEIFNYRELRAPLSAAGHVFHSTGDAEVLLHGYLQWGRDVVHRLVGQFAFAIWDERERACFLARDHLGIKPLYYAAHGGGLLFASEAKAICAAKAAHRSADWTHLSEYLAFLWVPGEATLFRGIRKLEPGCSITWRDGTMEVSRYWDASHAIVSPPNGAGGQRERAAEFRARLTEAVRLQLASDVPLGLLLSGGIDSTAVLSAMRSSGETPTAFTATYAEASRRRDVFDDDLGFARLAAGHYGATLLEATLSTDVVESLPRALWHLDEPLGDPTVITNLELTRRGKEHMTVMLSGMGGDEILAGYARYPATLFGERVRGVPAALWKGTRAGLDALVRSGLVPLRRARRALLLLEHLPKDSVRRFLGYSTYFDADRQRTVLTPDLLASSPPEAAFAYHEDLFARARAFSPLKRMLYVDLRTFLPCLNLENMDKTSMANAVEMRVPFLDHRLVEYTLGLPDSDLLAGRTRKHLLRRAFAGDVPDAILRRGKTGYNPPVRGWIRDTLRAYVRDMLLSPRAAQRGLINPEGVRRLIEENERGAGDHALRIWQLVALEQWLRTCIEDPPPALCESPDALLTVPNEQ